MPPDLEPPLAGELYIAECTYTPYTGESVYLPSPLPLILFTVWTAMCSLSHETVNYTILQNTKFDHV